MTVQILFQIGSFLLACVAFFISAATFLRAGKWRDSDEGKALIARIDRAEKWGDSEAAKRLIDTVDEHGKRLAAGEERFASLATKADVAEVKADVRGLEKSVDKVDAGVSRIERILMEHDK